MKNIYLLLFIILHAASAFAQDESLRFRKNEISLNIPSFTRLYSLNYERVLRQKKLVTVAHLGFFSQQVYENSNNLSAVFTGVDLL